MNGKLTIIYSDNTKETAVYSSVELAEQHERDIRIALGNQISFTCVMPTCEDVTVFDVTEKPYSKNPLDDMDFDEDDEDYFFDIPSDAF